MLEKLHGEGRAKAISLRNYSPGHIDEMKRDSTLWAPHVNQIKASLVCPYISSPTKVRAPALHVSTPVPSRFSPQLPTRCCPTKQSQPRPCRLSLLTFLLLRCYLAVTAIFVSLVLHFPSLLLYSAVTPHNCYPP